VTDEADPVPDYKLQSIDYDPFASGYRPSPDLDNVRFQHRLMRVMNAANARRDAVFSGHGAAPSTPDAIKQFQDAFKLYGARNFHEKLARLMGGGGGYRSR
jgi:hypothetical protein